MPRKRRSQTVHFGSIRAVRFGLPSPFADLYHRTMEMRWATFVAAVTLAFAAINLVFGLIYAALPGAIANARPGSLWDATFFSVDTLGTVGYGFMYPTTHAAHAIAATEILLGLFFSATITGLVFARFSRPRIGLAFSSCMVIGRHEGRPALMLRVASLRSQALADADAQLAWLETLRRPDGSTYRRFVELELVRSRNPMLGLAWTIVHVIEEDSPLLAAIESEESFMMTAMVRGTDTLLATPAIGSRTYLRGDIRHGHEFVDMLTMNDSAMILDMALLHETRAADDAAPDLA